jgi:hypothetical protein
LHPSQFMLLCQLLNSLVVHLHISTGGFRGSEGGGRGAWSQYEFPRSLLSDLKGTPSLNIAVRSSLRKGPIVKSLPNELEKKKSHFNLDVKRSLLQMATEVLRQKQSHVEEDLLFVFKRAVEITHTARVICYMDARSESPHDV